MKINKLVAVMAGAVIFSVGLTSCGDLGGIIGGDIGGIGGGGSVISGPVTPSVSVKDGLYTTSVHYDVDVNLEVVASTSDEGTLSYQWYSCDKSSFENPTAMANSTTAAITVKDNKESVSYYRCTVTNTKNGKTASANSNIVKVEVTNIIYADHVTTAQTWEAAYTYVVEGDISVNAKLTIEEGTVIKFGDCAGLTTYDTAVLNAIGTEEKPIIFTSVKDNSVGISIPDYKDNIPDYGDWEGVTIGGATGSKLDYCVIRYGGQEYYGALHLEKKATVTNCKFVSNATPDDLRGALNIDNGVVDSTVENNVFYDNMWPISIPSEFKLSATNIFHNPEDEEEKNNFQAIAIVNGNVAEGKNAEWNVTELPYYISEGFNVEGNLSIGADVIVRVASGIEIVVMEDATLTIADSAIITSFRDDANGGDIFNDGEDTAETGDWVGINHMYNGGLDSDLNKGANILYRNEIETE